MIEIAFNRVQSNNMETDSRIGSCPLAGAGSKSMMEVMSC